MDFSPVAVTVFESELFVTVFTIGEAVLVRLGVDVLVLGDMV